jgi:hypothetical protein
MLKIKQIQQKKLQQHQQKRLQILKNILLNQN